MEQRVVGEAVDGAHPHVVARDLVDARIEEEVALDGPQLDRARLRDVPRTGVVDPTELVGK